MCDLWPLCAELPGALGGLRVLSCGGRLWPGGEDPRLQVGPFIKTSVRLDKSRSINSHSSTSLFCVVYLHCRIHRSKVFIKSLLQLLFSRMRHSHTHQVIHTNPSQVFFFFFFLQIMQNVVVGLWRTFLFNIVKRGKRSWWQTEAWLTEVPSKCNHPLRRRRLDALPPLCSQLCVF